MSLTTYFTRFAGITSRLAGRAFTFVLCISLVLVWAMTGPLFGFSDTWQLIINTSTTIITFLMVFLIQNTQNRDNAALQAKLDELIRVSRGKNEMIGIENLTDKELENILREFDSKAVPMGEKSEIIAEHARKARERQEAKSKSKSKAKPAAGKKPASRRKPAARKPKAA